MQSRGPSGSSGGGGDGNDPPRETWEEQQRRMQKRGKDEGPASTMQKRGKDEGLAWIVLAHAPTTDACIYIYICYSPFHPLAFISDSFSARPTASSTQAQK